MGSRPAGDSTATGERASPAAISVSVVFRGKCRVGIDTLAKLRAARLFFLEARAHVADGGCHEAHLENAPRGDRTRCPAARPCRFRGSGPRRHLERAAPAAPGCHRAAGPARDTADTGRCDAGYRQGRAGATGQASRGQARRASQDASTKAEWRAQRREGRQESVAIARCRQAHSMLPRRSIRMRSCGTSRNGTSRTSSPRTRPRSVRLTPPWDVTTVLRSTPASQAPVRASRSA